jgi:hypothetical protein
MEVHCRSSTMSCGVIDPGVFHGLRSIRPKLLAMGDATKPTCAGSLDVGMSGFALDLVLGGRTVVAAGDRAGS